MANITAALVKELRERTNAGMMDCKKAIVFSFLTVHTVLLLLPKRILFLIRAI